MNTKKLFKFKETEYRKAISQGEGKLSAWKEVERQIGLLIPVPEDGSQYEQMLIDPLGYVSNVIDAKHRPNINIPIKTEKLLELLEIDLSPLKLSISAYQKQVGSLIVDDSGNVSFVVDEESFKVYAETEKEIQRLDASLKLIEAFTDLMTLNDKDFMKYGASQLNELRQATRNLLNWENGKLVPSEYWIKKA